MGKLWGEWETVDQIGEGGAGHVYRVRHRTNGQIGALKKLKNPGRIERFKSEVEAVRQLDHPNVVKLLDSKLDEEPFFAVFEFEEGGTLGDLPTEKLLAIPLPQRLQLCEQVCDGLQAAHQKRIVHRDVKPDNILLSRDRTTAKICDFGLVYVEDGTRKTATNEQIGSRFYIPPELEDGRADEVSALSDVYSMGKVLYYVTSGKVFAREQHRDAKYDLAVNHRDPHLDAISQILDRAITPDIGSRYREIAAMRIAIRMAREAIEERRPICGIKETYRCLFCRVGVYKEVCVSNTTECHNRGFSEGNVGNEQMVYLECENCGNTQRFKLKYTGKNWFKESYDKLRQ